MKTLTINLMIIVTIPLSLWLGFTGRVDWWVILLILLFDMKIPFQRDL